MEASFTDRHEVVRKSSALYDENDISSSDEVRFIDIETQTTARGFD